MKWVRVGLPISPHEEEHQDGGALSKSIARGVVQRDSAENSRSTCSSTNGEATTPFGDFIIARHTGSSLVAYRGATTSGTSGASYHKRRKRS
ncbi:MAG: hypothetical protein ACREQW_18620 [Candidatus Binatia bacterium]